MANLAGAFRESLPGRQLEVVAMVVNSTDHIGIIQTICEDLVPLGVQTLLSAVFGGSYMDNYIATRHITMTTGYLGLPIIGLNEEMTCVVEEMDEHEVFLQIGSSISQQVGALLAFLEYHHWYHFAIITSQLPGRVEFLSELQHRTIGEGSDHDSSWEICETFAMGIGENDTITSTLSKLTKGECTIIILFADAGEAREVFKVAEELDLLTYGYIWLVLELSLGGHEGILKPPPEFPVGLVAVKFEGIDYTIDDAIVDAATTYTTRLTGYLADGYQIELGNNAGCKAQGGHSYHGSKYFYDYLTRDEIPYKNFVFDKHGVVKNPKLSILNLDSSRTWKEVGYWQDNNMTMATVLWIGGTHEAPKGLSPHRHMRFTTIVEEPFVLTIPLEKNEVVCKYGVKCGEKNETTRGKCCLGFCISLLEKLKEDIGFTYELRLVDDGNYGAKVEADGKEDEWNGMIGAIVKHRADAAIGAVRITEERSEVVDFSTPFISTGISVLVKKKDGEIPNSAFLGSFHLSVWIFLLVIAVNVTAVVVFIFEWFSPGGYDRNFDNGRASKFTIGSSIWMTYGILFNNTVHLNVPRSYTAKFVTNMWACFALVFVAMYTADLVTHMIQEDSHRIITGFNDPKLQYPLSSRKPLRFATVASSSVENLIKKSNKEMHTYMQKFVKRNTTEAVNALKRGELDAFIYDSEVLNSFAKKDDHCDLMLVGDVYASTGYAVAFEKDSHWKERFDSNILHYNHNGFLQKISDTWMESTCDTVGGNTASRQRLGIENLAGVFYLLSAGILASLAVFVVEHFCRTCCQKIQCFEGHRKKQSLSVLVQVVAQNLSTPHRVAKDPVCHNIGCLRQTTELRRTRSRIAELEKALAKRMSSTSEMYSNDPSEDKPGREYTDTPPLENGDHLRSCGPWHRKTYDDMAVDQEELVPLKLSDQHDIVPNNISSSRRQNRIASYPVQLLKTSTFLQKYNSSFLEEEEHSEEKRKRCLVRQYSGQCVASLNAEDDLEEVDLETTV
uniref:Glutamate receptor ionotropic, NMDA 2B n=2 Tax=Saccoglossus kowalevskii TaxID=10224 RepID=A0ABM0GML6_SACKO|nr:PREDICTED: glutamate receptor ionotropic, NMDA 2B [Saccoglossus kowalevskii]